MTTSWSNFVRGRIRAALAANVGGTLLAVAAAVCAPWSVISGIRGRLLFGPPNDRVVLGIGFAVIFVTFAEWAVRLLFSPGS